MKAALLLLAFALSAHADVHTCSATAFLPSTFVSGSCFNGSCQGYFGSKVVPVQGSCGGSIGFNAQGVDGGGFLQGTCNNGFLSILLSGGVVPLNGTCSNGGMFTGTARVSSQFLNGSCSTAGFSIFVPGTMATVSGSCVGGNP